MNKYEVGLDNGTFLNVEAEGFYETENSVEFYVKKDEKEEVVAKIHDNRYSYIIKK